MRQIMFKALVFKATGTFVRLLSHDGFDGFESDSPERKF